MQFIVMGHDGKDTDALPRRMAAREAHLARTAAFKQSGQCLYAAALLDAEQRMVGSMMVMEFADAAELDAWLRDEPYVTGGVWERVETYPCRVPDAFRTRGGP